MDGPDAPNLHFAWYEAWMAEDEVRRAAEAAARAEMRRGVRVLILRLVGRALAAGAAGALAVVHRTEQMVHHLIGASRCTAPLLVGRLIQTDE